MKPRLGLDIDGVLADWLGAIHILVYNATGGAIDVFKESTSYWEPDGVLGDILQYYTTSPQIYPSLVPIAGSIQAVNGLADTFGIYYISHRPKSIYDITKHWLNNYGYPLGEVLLVDDKVDVAKQLNIHYFVDDNPQTIAYMKENLIRSYLFNCSPLLWIDKGGTWTSWGSLYRRLIEDAAYN